METTPPQKKLGAGDGSPPPAPSQHLLLTFRLLSGREIKKIWVNYVNGLWLQAAGPQYNGIKPVMYCDDIDVGIVCFVFAGPMGALDSFLACPDGSSCPPRRREPPLRFHVKIICMKPATMNLEHKYKQQVLIKNAVQIWKHVLEALAHTPRPKRPAEYDCEKRGSTLQHSGPAILVLEM